MRPGTPRSTQGSPVLRRGTIGNSLNAHSLRDQRPQLASLLNGTLRNIRILHFLLLMCLKEKKNVLTCYLYRLEYYK